MRFKLLLALLLLSGMAMAEGGLPEPKGGVTIYVVRPGDTLWQVSDRFYGNPLLWPRLWELNPYIDNPDLIYPGDVLSLKQKPPDLPVVKFSPEVKEVSVTEIEPPPPVFYYSRGKHGGFLGPSDWENTGSILNSEPPKILLGEGDIVYTNVGSAHGAVPGDRYMIYRSSSPVIHPVNGNRIGHKIAIFGEIQIKDILGKKMSAARITESYREITRGAKLRPASPYVKEVVLRKGKVRTDGYIVETLNNTELSGRGDVVYVDVGLDDGVLPGNVFSVFTFPRESYDPDAGTSVIIPGALIGKLIILDVKGKTSTALITQSKRQIERGAIVSLDL